MVTQYKCKIINRTFHLIDCKSALAAGFALEFHDSSALGAQPPFTVGGHHPADACGPDSFGAFKCVQFMPFDVFFGVLFHQRARKLAAASAVAEVFGIKTGFYLAFQTGLAFAVVAYKTASAGVLKSFAADAVYPAGSQQF